MSESAPTPPATPPYGSPLATDLQAYIYLLRDRWMWIVLAVLLCVGAGVYYLVKTPRVYASRCVVQVELEQMKILKDMVEVASEDLKSTESLKTVEQALGSSTLLLRVASDLKLWDDPEIVPPGSPRPTDAQMAKSLANSVKARLRRGTRLIDIEALDTNPERARRLARGVADQYIATSTDQKVAVTSTANEYLSRQAEELKAKLLRSEMALQEYREKNNAISLEDKQNTIDTSIAALSTQLNLAKNTVIQLESALRDAREAKAGSGEDLLNISSIAELPEIAELKRLINIKASEVAQLKERYLPLHPKMTAAQGELQKLQTSLSDAALKAISRLEITYRAAQEQQKGLEEALKKEQTGALDLAKLAVNYNALLREVETDRQLATAIFTRVRETRLSEQTQSANVRIIEEPLAATKPSKPIRSLTLAGALFAGLLLGVGGVVGLDLMDSSFRSIDQAESVLGMDAIAAIPQSRSKHKRSRLEIVNEPNSATAEAFRGMRTTISLLDTGTTGKIVMITSAVPGEGKSYCAANYAVALAHQGLRTLLIDADLRRPAQEGHFPAGAEAPGLAAVLQGKSGLHEAYIKTDVDNLCLLPAGKERATNPAELLAGKRFSELIAEVSDAFDRIVIDTAPINAVSDTLLLTAHAHVIGLVIRAERTPRRAVVRACRLLARSRTPAHGFMLNCLRQNSSSRFYYYAEGNYSSAGVYGT